MMKPDSSYLGKILSLDQLIEIRRGLSVQGQTLVQCHGCFDIVHPGHIRHLRFAAAQGDRLIVSITADAFVNKGPGRPMFSDELRSENLAALEFVDWVYIHRKPTAVELLAEIKPDVYIKGAEYAQNTDQRFVEERSVVESNNGRVVFSSGEVVFSSTSIVETIQQVSRADPGAESLEMLSKSHDLSTSGIGRRIEKAKSKKVLVLGETIVDTYTQCHWPEIADEHPMLSLCPISAERYDGGAAIVARHLAAHGMHPVLCTPIPLCEESSRLIARLESDGVEVVSFDIGKEIPEKNRFIVGRDKVMKLDRTSRMDLNDRQRADVVGAVQGINDLDAAILTDFGLGFFKHGLIDDVCQVLKNRVELIMGDVSGVQSGLLSMSGINILCPSETELRHALNDSDSSVADLAAKLIEITNASVVVVTLAHDGLLILGRDLVPVLIPALSRDPVDVLGCGDALLASMCVSLLGGGGVVESAYAGSVAAAVAGSVLGNVPVGTYEVLSRSQSLGAGFAHCVSQIEYKVAQRDADGLLS